MSNTFFYYSKFIQNVLYTSGTYIQHTAFKFTFIGFFKIRQHFAMTTSYPPFAKVFTIKFISLNETCLFFIKSHLPLVNKSLFTYYFFNMSSYISSKQKKPHLLMVRFTPINPKRPIYLLH